MAHGLDTLPLNLTLIVLMQLPAEDHLNSKLVSKVLHPSARLAYTFDTNLEKIDSHLEYEFRIPARRRLRCCICTNCARVMDTVQFSDYHTRKTNRKRLCIACVIRAGNYSDCPRSWPRVKCIRRLPCFDCKRDSHEN